MKDSSSTQLELSFMDAIRRLEPIIGASGDIRWCYIINPREQTMLAMDNDGNWIWIAHDTVRLMPHLFGGLHLARETACLFEHVLIERYRWSKPIDADGGR